MYTRIYLMRIIYAELVFGVIGVINQTFILIIFLRNLSLGLYGAKFGHKCMTLLRKYS